MTNKLEKKFLDHMRKYEERGVSYLEDYVPEINKIKSCEEISDLKMIKQHYIKDMILVLEYNVKAPSLFPAIRQRFIDKGLAKRCQICHTSFKNVGTPEEIYNLTLGFYGNSLQLSLNFSK